MPTTAKKTVARKRSVAAPARNPARAKPKADAAPVKPAKPPKAPKAPKAPKREALVRDSFTMPQADFALIATLKERAVQFKRPAKKSELLRAGIAVLKSLSDDAFRQALAAVPSLKTGRPPKEGEEGDEGGEPAPRVGKRIIDKTADRAAAAGKAGRPEKAERAERAAARAANKPARAERQAAKPARPARANKPAKPEKPARADKAAKAARLARKAS